MSELIIDKPQALSLGQKFGQKLLTIGFWALFIYLLRPLLAVFAWAFGVIRFNEVMIVQQGLDDLLHLVKWYFLVVVVMGLIFETWAFYNLLRFRGKERRRAAPPVGTERVAAFFRVDPRLLIPWRDAVSLRLHHDPEGNIVGGEAGPTGEGSPATAPKSEDVQPPDFPTPSRAAGLSL